MASDLLAAKISAWPGKINRDLVPVSYYFQSVLWAAQFRGLESKLRRAAGGIPRGWLLDAPLGAFGLVLALFALRGRRSAARFLVPVAVMGFTSIVVELAMFIVFQANFGYVYGKIPLLLAVFMGGLMAGSLLARRRLHPGRAALPAVQAGLVAALAVALVTLSGRGGEFVPFGLLFVFGGLGAFSSGGSALAVGDGGRVHIWDLEKEEGSELNISSPSSIVALRIEFIDENLLAVQSDSSTISLWSLESYLPKDETFLGDLKQLNSNAQKLYYRDPEGQVILVDLNSDDLSQFQDMRAHLCKIVSESELSEGEQQQFFPNGDYLPICANPSSMSDFPTK